jgi:hypothetical protein
MSKVESLRPLPRRESSCADASFDAEIKRVYLMSVEDRIIAALSMASDFAWLQPTPIQSQEDEGS